MTDDRLPFARGTAYALVAAVAFGATVPFLAAAGADVGPLTTASLLYLGAALSALPIWTQIATGAPLRREHFGRLMAMALIGAAVAPTLLVWGLKHTGATAGSLLLNLEAVFTAVLAWLVYREQLGRRAIAALALMVLGGVALVMNGMWSSGWNMLGVAAVSGATLAWGIDNTLSRGLAEQDPVSIVGVKGVLGAAATAGAALCFGERLPSLWAALLLVVCGLTGYGYSLRFYLLAQRRIGAARTGSLFAVAPFVGAMLSAVFVDKAVAPGTKLAAPLFLVGFALHLTERHHHGHAHPALDHDHPHRHDDGHHEHEHVPAFVGEHSHPHHHERLEHDHEHAPDVHHDHLHE